MCYHKSLAEQYDALMDHYSASFDSITEELDYIKERFAILMSKDDYLRIREPEEATVVGDRLAELSKKGAAPNAYTKEEISEMKWSLKTLQSFTDSGFRRFHENGFDYLPTPIITAGAPEEFKLFRWGLIPFYMNDKKQAYDIRLNTLNCISEEMYDKPSFKDALKNSQRCLIPITGFFEWRWLDEKGKNKIPYYVSTKEQQISSLAGLYSRWKDKETGEYYYSYTVLTTWANSLMEYVHNNKRRMPVIIPREFERDWLNKDLPKEDILALCQPYKSELMRANTVSKLITTKEVDTNVAEVLQLHSYEKIGTDEIVSQL